MSARFRDEDELEDELSRPDDAVRTALGAHLGTLVVLGAAGKMGPTLARMARRAGVADVVAVSRFGDERVRERLEHHGVRTIPCDLLDREAVQALPDAALVIFLAGQKFGTSDRPASTWAMNALVPAIVAERYPGVPTVVFSSGNVYPFTSVGSNGAGEDTPPDPLGEYAWSVLARERMFEHAAARVGTPCVFYRLNYASEPRYGVLVDIANAVHAGRPIGLAMGYLNTIWQRDANAIALRCSALATNPPAILNVTGTRRIAVRDVAEWFGRRFGRDFVFDGVEQDTALLSDATRMVERFGEPATSLEFMLEAIAGWIEAGNSQHGKPTHYEVRDGSY